MQTIKQAFTTYRQWGGRMPIEDFEWAFRNATMDTIAPVAFDNFDPAANVDHPHTQSLVALVNKKFDFDPVVILQLGPYDLIVEGEYRLAASLAVKRAIGAIIVTMDM